MLPPTPLLSAYSPFRISSLFPRLPISSKNISFFHDISHLPIPSENISFFDDISRLPISSEDISFFHDISNISLQYLMDSLFLLISSIYPHPPNISNTLSLQYLLYTLFLPMFLRYPLTPISPRNPLPTNNSYTPSPDHYLLDITPPNI